MSYNSKHKSREIEEILDSVGGKQDTIADLDAIRSGAEKGATALQSIPSEYVTESELTAKGYATTSALNDKVDKVSGKQLSTEDFTSALKAKLEGLSNYDDTTLANAISGLETRLNTLVSGDASAAIESFNEIVAFLNGVEDSESLDSIIAAIEQQIAGKQDKLVSGTNIKTINGESILGEGNIVVNVDTSNLATKEEVTSLTNEIIANEEVHAGAYNDLNTRLNELSENVQGETVTKEEFNAAIEGVNNGISAKQDVLVSGTNIKTINNESILGSGNIEINVDTSSLASKEELQNLQNEVIANEEVVAAAFNDVNERINAISENVSGTTVTKEELESTVETINQTISDNKSATDTAIEGLETSIGNVDAKFANYATTESLNGAVETINNTIVENEEITAAAINDLNARLAALGATAIQSVKTINGQSIVGEGDITIEGSGASGGEGGNDVANVYLPMFAELTDDELAKNKIAFEKMKNGASVQFVASQYGSYVYSNFVYLYHYLSEDDIVAFIVDYDVIYCSGTTITSLIHKEDRYVMYPDGSVVLELSSSEEPSTPASSGPFKLWYSPVVELTEKQINDNKASYNEVRNGGAIDSVYYIVEEGAIGYLRLLMTGLVGGIVVVVAADIAIAPNGEVTAVTIDLELSEDGTVTLIPKPAQ